MLEYGRIDISEGVDVNEINLLKECEICQKKTKTKRISKKLLQGCKVSIQQWIKYFFNCICICNSYTNKIVF